jgi:hypothetical protein
MALVFPAPQAPLKSTVFRSIPSRPIVWMTTDWFSVDEHRGNFHQPEAKPFILT